MEIKKGLDIKLPLSGSIHQQLEQIDEGLKKTGVDPEEISIGAKLAIWNQLNIKSRDEKTQQHNSKKHK